MTTPKDLAHEEMLEPRLAANEASKRIWRKHGARLRDAIRRAATAYAKGKEAK